MKRRRGSKGRKETSVARLTLLSLGRGRKEEGAREDEGSRSRPWRRWEGGREPQPIRKLQFGDVKSSPRWDYLGRKGRGEGKGKEGEEASISKVLGNRGGGDTLLLHRHRRR